MSKSQNNTFLGCLQRGARLEERTRVMLTWARTHRHTFCSTTDIFIRFTKKLQIKKTGDIKTNVFDGREL